jgi:two-component system response regulator GlrR
MSSSSAKKILFIEDNPAHLALYARQLEQEAFEVVKAGSAEEALEHFSDDTNVVITDMYLPGMDGGELMRRIHERRSEVPVIILTNRGRVEESLGLIRAGAFDYVQKTQGFKDFLLRVARAVVHEELVREVRDLRSQLDRGRAIVPSSDPRMIEVLKRVDAVAPTSYPVLLSGESGTGKEVIARLVHRKSSRAGGKFVTLNCGAIPKDLFERELFGHVRGSFTGATEDRPGMFEEAEGGTLFLDEIGEIAAEHQVKLLRTLEDGEVRRLGETRVRKVAARVVAASNRDLAEAVRQGQFREDLFYRIQVMVIHLPPLRDRREDILPLAQHFLREGTVEAGKKVAGFSREAAEALLRHPWPGNIRELANKVRQALIVCSTDRIQAADLSLDGPSLRSGPTEEDLLSLPLTEARRQFECRYLGAALQRARGNVSKAAETAGKHRSEFYQLLKRHSLDPEPFRAA